MNIQELRDERSNENLTNQPCMVKSKIDSDGTLVQTVTLLKNIDSLDCFLDSTDKPFDEGSVNIREADFFIGTDENIIFKVEKSCYG